MVKFNKVEFYSLGNKDLFYLYFSGILGAISASLFLTFGVGQLNLSDA